MKVTDTPSFIAKAKLLHGDKYDYTKTNYVGSKTVVVITCKIHGDFKQIPTNHYTKSGCPKCAGSGYIRSTAEILEEFKNVHGDKYDYSLVNYVNENTHVDIICNTHGIFKQQPKGHKQGQGCPTCAKQNKKLSQEKVINRFIQAHGSKFDYSKVNYMHKDEKVAIQCPIHGEFWQRASDHWKGMGCQKCSLNGFQKDMPGYLYYLSINNGEAYKIGITNKTVETRFTVTDLKAIEIVDLVYFALGEQAYNLEQSILKKYSPYKYTGNALLSSGNTELFNTDIRTINEVTSIREL